MTGWPEVTLGELCHIARGGSPRPIKSFLTNGDNGINWIKISDATAGDGKYIASTQERIRPEGLKMSRLVEPGDFLLSNSMSFGRPYIMRTTGCIHDGWLVLRDKSHRFDPDYLYYFLGSDMAYRQFDSLAAGSTVRNLNTDLVKTVKVVLPPLEKQRRIVAMLDEAFAGIATATANVEKNLANARELFERHSDALFSQISAAAPRMAALSDLTVLGTGITYGVVKPGPEGCISFVRGGDLISGKVRTNQLRTISKEVSDQYRRTLLRGGELLICLVGTPGQCAIVPTELAGANIARQVGMIRLRDDVNAPYVRDYLLSSVGQKALGLKTGGSVQQVINLSDLKLIEIPLPDSGTQLEVVTRVAAMKQASLALAVQYRAKLDALAALKRSLLKLALIGKPNANMSETIAA